MLPSAGHIPDFPQETVPGPAAGAGPLTTGTGIAFMHLTRSAGNAVGAALLALAITVPAHGAGTSLHLKGTTWGFASDSGEAGRSVHFTGDGRLQGFGGCNHFSGRFTMSGDTLSIGPLVATLRACADDVMRREGELFQALQGTRMAASGGDDLILKTADGTVLATLARRSRN